MTILGSRCPWNALFPALAGALFLSAMLTAPAAGQGNPSGLRLSLDIGKSEAVVGEPIYATLTLTNEGTAALPVFPDLYPEVGVGAIEIRHEGSVELFRPMGVDDVDTQVQELPPGQSLSATFPIFFGGPGWTFTSPGSYQLTGMYRHPTAGPSGVLSSSPVVLTMVEGGAAGALLTDDSPASYEAGLYMLWEGGDHLRRGIARLQTLIEEYPNQIQADYARLSLGLSLSRGFRDYSIGKVRPPDYVRAKALLEPINEGRLQPFAGLRKVLAEAQVMLALDDDRRARAAADRAIAIVRQHPALSNEIDQMIRIAPRLEPLLKR